MRNLFLSGLTLLVAIPVLQGQSTQKWPDKAPTNGPMYKVDPFWPKPLPNKWSMQQIVDIYVDKDDHIWIINRQTDARPDETGAAATNHHIECCVPGPEIIQFDQQGNVLKSWDGKGTPGWPGRLQTLGVDRNLNIYVSGTTPGDTIAKYDTNGKFLSDFGHRGPKIPANQVKQNNQQTDIFPPGIGAFDFDEDAHEIYISDGFLNKRVLVYDFDTGAFKRGWGGHGIPLSEIDNDPIPEYDLSAGSPPDQKQFAPALHCAHPSNDGFVYVCERGSDSIQVFTKQGKFVNRYWIHPSTQSRGPHCGGIWSTTDPPCGSIYNLALSTDKEQRYIFVADGTNNTVWILNRKTGELVGSFGGNGRYAGQLHWIDAIAVDSKGNVYTGEVEDGKRIQKFVPVNNLAKAAAAKKQ